MPFRGIQTKLRNDPLGPGGLAQLAENLRWVRDLAAAEHIVGTGEHNAWQVPRRLVNINSAGSTISPSNSDVLTVSNPATGRYALTFAVDRFSSEIRPQLNVDHDAVITKPCLVGYQVLSARSIEVHTKQLSSALGAGNTWADTNMSFSVALHSDPLPRGSFTADALGHARGETLTEVSTDWDATVQAHGDMRVMLAAAHTEAGAHDVFEVAKHYARVNFNPTGSTYELGDASSGMSVARLGAGIAEVSFPQATAPLAAFVCPDYLRTYGGGSPEDLLVMHAKGVATTRFEVYIYEYDQTGNTWDRADADFFIAVHGS